MLLTCKQGQVHGCMVPFYAGHWQQSLCARAFAGFAQQVCIQGAAQVVIAAVGDKDSTYADFVASFPENDCRYGGSWMFCAWLGNFAASFKCSLRQSVTAPAMRKAPVAQCLTTSLQTARAASSTS